MVLFIIIIYICKYTLLYIYIYIYIFMFVFMCVFLVIISLPLLFTLSVAIFGRSDAATPRFAPFPPAWARWPAPAPRSTSSSTPSAMSTSPNTRSGSPGKLDLQHGTGPTSSACWMLSQPSTSSIDTALLSSRRTWRWRLSMRFTSSASTPTSTFGPPVAQGGFQSMRLGTRSSQASRSSLRRVT